MDYYTYWGDTHCNLHRSHIPTLGRTFEAARATLDFFPVAYYPADFYEMMEGLRVESRGPRNRFERDWCHVLEAVRGYHAPGSFVTYPGYEWTGNRTRYGDYNVFYCADEGPLDLSEDVTHLFARLRKLQAVAIPHHPALPTGWRGIDWAYCDEDLSPFVEIYSSHGSSEGCNTPYTLGRHGAMAPRVSGGTVQDALARGLRLGIVASNDSHNGVAGMWGYGLMAALAPELTREALWGAFKARRVYGVTGDRIQLGFTIDNQPMGSVIRADGPLDIRVAVRASQGLDRIELLRNNRVIRTHCHCGTWHVPEGDRRVRAKLKVECGWGSGSLQPRMALGPKQWYCELRLSDGRLISYEPCFTYWGQVVQHLDERACRWLHTTAQMKDKAEGECQQAMVFELEMPPEAHLTIRVDDRTERLTLAQAMKASRLIVFADEAEKLIENRFRLTPTEIEGRDVFWCAAYKAKIHTAIPEAGYTAICEWTDRDAPPGRNWYYVRVGQLNGQMAWSSPIWVETS